MMVLKVPWCGIMVPTSKNSRCAFVTWQVELSIPTKSRPDFDRTQWASGGQPSASDVGVRPGGLAGSSRSPWALLCCCLAVRFGRRTAEFPAPHARVGALLEQAEQPPLSPLGPDRLPPFL
jgi:hypothetical protein